MRAFSLVLLFGVTLHYALAFLARGYNVETLAGIIIAAAVLFGFIATDKN